ncbi:MAG: acetone carboxylase subunit gamma [Firmicutes bacterium]|nr:acetone carboxylase subunit gamma [Bacillota bacterium]
MRAVRVTEYLDIDLVSEQWVCNRCGFEIGSAHHPYKLGLLLRQRDPREVHPVLNDHPHFNFSFDPDWIRLIEFYCPGCGTLVETEYLPPGHPLTHDIELDIEALKAKYLEK